MTGLDLKIARIKRGCKQIELSRRTGIRAQRLSMFENEWAQPRPDELSAIRAALELEEQPTESEQVASAA